MSEPTLIGRYQLENLLRNGVRFNYFDLSTMVTENPLLIGAVKLDPVVEAERALESFVEAILGKGFSPDAPIVLICENGQMSIEVARALGQRSFMNVFVIEGGVESLS